MTSKCSPRGRHRNRNPKGKIQCAGVARPACGPPAPLCARSPALLLFAGARASVSDWVMGQWLTSEDLSDRLLSPQVRTSHASRPGVVRRANEHANTRLRRGRVSVYPAFSPLAPARGSETGDPAAGPFSALCPCCGGLLAINGRAQRRMVTGLGLTADQDRMRRFIYP